MSEDTEKEDTTQDITIESLIAKTDEILDEFEDPRSIITELRTALKAAQKDAADALIDATRAAKERDDMEKEVQSLRQKLSESESDKLRLKNKLDQIYTSLMGIKSKETK